MDGWRDRFWAAVAVTMIAVAAFQQGIIEHQRKQLIDQVWTINGITAREKEEYRQRHNRVAICQKPQWFPNHVKDADFLHDPLVPEEQ